MASHAGYADIQPARLCAAGGITVHQPCQNKLTSVLSVSRAATAEEARLAAGSFTCRRRLEVGRQASPILDMQGWWIKDCRACTMMPFDNYRHERAQSRLLPEHTVPAQAAATILTCQQNLA